MAETHTFNISVIELPGSLGRKDKWQADHGNDHARGKTAGEAVDRLIKYVRAKSITEAGNG